MPEEKIICYQPPSHALGAPHDYTVYGVVFTNQRIIFYFSKIFGINLMDFRWSDLRDIKIYEGAFSSEIIFEMKDRKVYSIGSNRDKDQMRKLYSLAGELKTKMQDPQAIVQQESVPSIYNPVEKLKQLKGMLDTGLISQSEYDAKKADILSRM